MGSICQEAYGAEILVYDNASTDDSIAWIKGHLPQVSVIESLTNRGFCGGYNDCFRYIHAPFTVLLNSDVEVTEGWLAPLLNALRTNALVAAVQPKIKAYHQKTHFEYAGAAGGYLDWLGYPFCRGRIFETLEEDLGQYDDQAQVFWASGACMAIRTSVFKDLGGFDERFFAHMEEIDLCWRAQLAGHQIWYVPTSTVYHVGGASLSYGSARKIRLNFRNNMMMLAKNLHGWQKFQVLFLRLILDGVAGLFALTKGQWTTPWAIIQGHFQFYGSKPSPHNSPKNNQVKLAQISIVWA